jgi:hypothetical protein
MVSFAPRIGDDGSDSPTPAYKEFLKKALRFLVTILPLS